ncbi:DUF6907 domain-containing protein [Streptomyces sp. NPDC054933]
MQSTSNVTHLPTAPAPSAQPRSWLRKIVGGGQIIETCPGWCEDHHVNDDSGALDDLCHTSEAVSVRMPVHLAGSGLANWPILAARINVDPYSDDPARRVPHVNFEPAPDDVMESLDPDEFAAAIAQVRAHCDRLDGVHARLVAARAEYGAL